MSSTRKFKAKELKDLRKKSKKDLLKQCDDLKKELHQLRVAQVSGGAPAKVANIRTTRKNIARIFTIISQITKEKVLEEYQKRNNNKLLPLDLRKKLTRKERLKLANNLRFKKTRKKIKLIKKYSKRKFAVIDKANYLPKNIRKLNIQTILSKKKSSSKYYKYIKIKQNNIKNMQIKRKKRFIKNTKPIRKYKKRIKKQN